MADAGHTTLTLDAGVWLQQAAALAGAPAEALAAQLLAALEAAEVATRLTVTVPLPEVALPGEGPTPADPVLLVQTFAAALHEAETTLGAQHLAVAGSTLDATLTIAAGDNSTARARLALTIAPRSHP